MAAAGAGAEAQAAAAVSPEAASAPTPQQEYSSAKQRAQSLLLSQLTSESLSYFVALFPDKEMRESLIEGIRQATGVDRRERELQEEAQAAAEGAGEDPSSGLGAGLPGRSSTSSPSPSPLDPLNPEKARQALKVAQAYSCIARLQAGQPVLLDVDGSMWLPGQQTPAHGCPMRRIYLLANERNMWLNLQEDGGMDLRRAFNPAVAAAVRTGTVSSWSSAQQALHRLQEDNLCLPLSRPRDLCDTAFSLGNTKQWMPVLPAARSYSREGAPFDDVVPPSSFKGDRGLLHSSNLLMRVTSPTENLSASGIGRFRAERGAAAGSGSKKRGWGGAGLLSWFSGGGGAAGGGGKNGSGSLGGGGAFDPGTGLDGGAAVLPAPLLPLIKRDLAAMELSKLTQELTAELSDGIGNLRRRRGLHRGLVSDSTAFGPLGPLLRHLLASEAACELYMPGTVAAGTAARRFQGLRRQLVDLLRYQQALAMQSAGTPVGSAAAASGAVEGGDGASGGFGAADGGAAAGGSSAGAAGAAAEGGAMPSLGGATAAAAAREGNRATAAAGAGRGGAAAGASSSSGTAAAAAAAYGRVPSLRSELKLWRVNGAVPSEVRKAVLRVVQPQQQGLSQLDLQQMEESGSDAGSFLLRPNAEYAVAVLVQQVMSGVLVTRVAIICISAQL